MRIALAITIISITLGTVSNNTSAATLTLLPTQAIALPNGESGEARALLLFDVSQLPIGSSQVVDEALLEWNLEGMGEESEYTFSLIPIGEAWASATDDLNAVTSDGPLDAAAIWTFEPLDFARNGRGLVRFDMTELVNDWLTGRRANFGVVISTGTFDAVDFEGKMGGGLLTVLYEGE